MKFVYGLLWYLSVVCCVICLCIVVEFICGSLSNVFVVLSVVYCAIYLRVAEQWVRCFVCGLLWHLSVSPRNVSVVLSVVCCEISLWFAVEIVCGLLWHSCVFCLEVCLCFAVENLRVVCYDAVKFICALCC